MLIASIAALQGSSLTLGSGTAAPGGTVSLPLSLVSSQAGAVSSLEWTLTFSTAEFSDIHISTGPSATQSGKSVHCHASSAGRYKCVLAGGNITGVMDGIIANAVLTVATSASSSSAQVGVVSSLGATASGDAAAVSSAGGSVTIPHVTSVSALNCSPSTLRVFDTAACNITLTAAAPAGGLSVGLGMASSSRVNVTMPPSVTVPAAAATAGFNLQVSAAESSTTLSVLATANGVTKSLSIPVLAPSVSVSPAAATLYGGESRQFSASVVNASNAGVTWSLSPSIGTVSPTGLYTAPSSIAAGQLVSIRATSIADPAKFATSTVQLAAPVPVVISLSPVNPEVGPGQRQQFTASIIGMSNTAVEWTVSPAAGSINASGLYTAPAEVSSTQTVTVRATSTADPTKFATTTLRLNPAPAIPAGLVAYWPFSEGAGTSTADQSGNGHTAKLSSATWTSGHSGGALSFNGSNAFADAGPFNATGTAITISAWFKAKTLPDTDPRIISKASGVYEDDHFFMISTTNVPSPRLRFRLKTGGSTKTLVGSTGTVPTGEWVHTAATYDGTSMRLYQNGVLVGSMSASGQLDVNSSAPVCIGSNPNAYGVFDGSIDEVRIYSHALSESDIQNLYKGEQPNVSVVVTPGSAVLWAGSSQQFTASVTGSANAAVTWSLNAPVGTISPAGVYTAPAVAGSTQTVSVRATSVADPAKSASANITVHPPVAISVSPATATLQASQTKQFTASVTGGTGSPGTVTWSLNPAAGSISSSGLYTAPASITSAQSVTIQATSTLDRTKYATATVTLQPPVAETKPGDGLVAYWRFNEGYGRFTADASGNGHTATLFGAAWATIARSGKSMLFDGRDDYLSMGNLDVTGSAMTISAWIRPHVLTDNEPRIISKATGSDEQDHYFMLGMTKVSGVARLRFRLKTSGDTKTLIASSGTLTATKWMHSVATYDGSVMRLYLNGVLAGSMAATGPVTGSSAVPVTLGRNPQNFGAYDGNIDEVKIYNRALSAAEILSLYSSTQ
jgi:VCBS repeat-containing protein